MPPQRAPNDEQRRLINRILSDRNLASLGDAFVNFVYSIALSRTIGIPQGTKVKGELLAEAARETGIKAWLKSRKPRKDSANALEALMAHGYLNGEISIDEAVEILSKNIDNIPKGFAALALLVLDRIELSVSES